VQSSTLTASTMSNTYPNSIDTAASTDANLRPTAILDYRSPPIQAIVARLERRETSPLARLQSAYQILRDEIGPIYTVNDLQPTSATILKCQGSCSQRFACLESVARAIGTPTRVRGLWVAGRLWNPRFKFTKSFIPSRILLAWPQFHLDGCWISVEELFGPSEQLAQENPGGFTNDDESLFDAVDHIALDFAGKTSACGAGACDLSGFVVGDAGPFDTRDDLFAAIPSLQRTLRGRAFELIYGGRKSC